MLRSLFIFLLLISFSSNCISQSYRKRIEIRTTCDQTKSDTTGIEFYSKSGKILSRKNTFPPVYTTNYKYDNLDRLTSIEKIAADDNKIFELLKIQYIGSDTSKSTDTLFNKEGVATLIRLYAYNDSLHQVYVTGKASFVSAPITNEIVQLDGSNKELSNSICSGIQSCITNKLTYVNGKLSVKEKWQLKQGYSLPVLILTENYVYDEKDFLKAIVINIVEEEKEKCKERLFYSYE